MDNLLGPLSLLTLIVVAAILAIAFAMFWRKRANRHALDKSPDGAIAKVKATDQA